MFKDVGILGGLVVCILLALFFSSSFGLTNPVSFGLAGVLLLIVAFITNFSLGSVLLSVLFITHALVGAVELGTDGWIQNITGNILTPAQGKILFVFTSAIMFSLRFCADFIEKKMRLSPIGILLACAILACVGLNLASAITTFVGAMLALSVYAVGKTFFWPTMLAVVGDRFPRSGAVAMSIIGGIGMMSAGLVGSPGLGYAKDRFTGAAIEGRDAQVFAEYKAKTPSKFLFFAEATGLDGKKLGELQAKLEDARNSLDESQDPQAALDALSENERIVHASSIEGDRKTLIADSFIPGTMAVIYLVLLIYFKAIGGYKPVHIAAESTGGKEGPMEV